jgi:hypothetical protein
VAIACVRIPHLAIAVAILNHPHLANLPLAVGDPEKTRALIRLTLRMPGGARYRSEPGTYTNRPYTLAVTG